MEILDYQQLVLKLFMELSAYWQDSLEPAEIGSDPKKIILMREVREALETNSIEIPALVLKLYEEVYLRDVWTKT